MENYPHLAFEPSRVGIAKLRGGGEASPQTVHNKLNRAEHKQTLQNSLDQIRNQFEYEVRLRTEQGLPSIPVGVPILLKVDPDGFDVEILKSKFWGLEVVCEMEDGFVIVVSPDVELTMFYEQLDRFANSKWGGGTVAGVHEIIFDEDHGAKLERILDSFLLERWNEIVNLTAISVEISIECLGTQKLPRKPERNSYTTDEGFRKAIVTYERELDEYYIEHDQLRMEREDSLDGILKFYGGSITSITEDGVIEGVEFADSFTVLATVSGEGLRDIALNYPYVHEIAAKEILSFENSGERTEVPGFQFDLGAPPSNAPTVVVIDSGIQEEHPLIAASIRKNLSHNFLNSSNTAPDDHPNYGGHGTRVAGAALYPNGIPNGSFQIPFFIANAKVLDSTGHIPEKVLPARLLEKIITYYSSIDASIKIYNHSIASAVPARQGYMSSWAAKIDDLSYEHDILFVQAAGNIPISSRHPSSLGIKEHLNAGRPYPNFLLEASCKVANPCQSFNALSVGSISGISHTSADYDSIGDMDGPAPFSRTGPSIWNVIKPDVVALGGNLMRSRDTLLLTISRPPETSLELVRRSDSGVLVGRSEVGTSFSAPFVAHQAAILQGLLPGESSLLYRGLIAQSARWPDWRSGTNNNFNNFAHFGFGLPSLERATKNSENRITFYSTNRRPIQSKEIHFFEVPIPEAIRRIGAEYDILIEVTLSYVGKPRRTRRNPRKYLSTWVEWVSSKLNESMDSFAGRVEIEGDQSQVQHSGEIPWMLRDRDDWGQVDGLKRNVGTLQKDWAVVKSYQLEESFSIAVRGRQGWDTTDRYPAYYSLIVSLEATNAEIELYDRIRTEVEIRERVNIGIQV